MKVYNTQNIIPAGTVMNHTITSTYYQLRDIYGFCIQVVYTGTPTGTFKLQASADPVPLAGKLSTEPPTHWTDIANSSYSVTAGGDYMWNVFDSMYNYVRIVYTDTSAGHSSTAVITSATINAKGV